MPKAESQVHIVFDEEHPAYQRLITLLDAAGESMKDLKAQISLADRQIKELSTQLENTEADFEEYKEKVNFLESNCITEKIFEDNPELFRL